MGIGRAMNRRERRFNSKQEKKLKETEEAEKLAEYGIKQQDLGNFAEAEKALKQALAAIPGHALALSSLGIINLARGNLDEASMLIEKSLKLDPSNEWTHSNLGTAESLKKNHNKAIQHYLDAIAINPKNPEIHRNFADVLCGAEKHAEAISVYEKALNLDPKNTGAWTNLGLALQRLGKIDEAIYAFKTSLNIAPSISAYSSLLLAMNYSAKFGPEDIFKETRCFAIMFAPETLKIPPAKTDLTPERKLKIGYVSPDFRNHPVAHFLKNTLCSHDKNNFEIFCYSNSVVIDEYTKILQKSADHWLNIAAMDDDAAAKKICADGIDILIDLSGHTGQHRLTLFARKPAPIQATWLGYPGTTGMSQMDYFICGEALIYPDLKKYFSEKFMAVAGHVGSVDMSVCNAEVGALPALTNKKITFGGFNSLAKLNPAVIALWAKILAAVPDSSLYLNAAALKEETRKNEYYELFANHGIEKERLRLEPAITKAEYFNSYNEIDIALDSFPYPGGATTTDTLWMGVPVITLAGKTTMARFGVSILTSAGYPEWIANSEDEYLAKAVKLSGDIEKLAKIRNEMRNKLRDNVLYHPTLFTRNLEQKLREAWREYCNNNTV